MSAWPRHELRQIAETDGPAHRSVPRRRRTYGTPTWTWSVVVDGELYVRPYNGRDSRWYQAAMRQKAGRITAAGMTKEVAFEPTGEAISDRIDEAYREKVPGQPLPRADAQHMDAFGDGEGRTASYHGGVRTGTQHSSDLQLVVPANQPPG